MHSREVTGYQLALQHLSVAPRARGYCKVQPFTRCSAVIRAAVPRARMPTAYPFPLLLCAQDLHHSTVSSAQAAQASRPTTAASRPAGQGPGAGRAALGWTCPMLCVRSGGGRVQGMVVGARVKGLVACRVAAAVLAWLCMLLRRRTSRAMRLRQHPGVSTCACVHTCMHTRTHVHT